MEEDAEIEYADPHDAIAQLEQRIEGLTAKIESCRKFILASRIAVVLGFLLLWPGIFWATLSQPTLLMTAIAAVIIGIVVSGSNASTQKEASAQLAATEAQRAALVDQLDLRVVSGEGVAGDSSQWHS